VCGRPGPGARLFERVAAPLSIGIRLLAHDQGGKPSTPAYANPPRIDTLGSVPALIAQECLTHRYPSINRRASRADGALTPLTNRPVIAHLSRGILAETASELHPAGRGSGPATSNFERQASTSARIALVLCQMRASASTLGSLCPAHSRELVR
jgi:hypothetical protein